MPLYDWCDKKTGKVVSVIRTFSEYEVPPTQEEAPDAVDPEWERLVGGNQSVIRAPGFGKKGYW